MVATISSLRAADQVIVDRKGACEISVAKAIALSVAAPAKIRAMTDTIAIERRTLFRHGALLLLLSAILGLVVVAPVPHPAKWMAAHVSGLLTGVLIIAIGAVWAELRLPPATRRRAMLMGLTAAWTGFVANAYAATVNLPGPATEPGRAPDAPWQLPVFLLMLAIVVPTTLGAFFLLWKGLRT